MKILRCGIVVFLALSLLAGCAGRQNAPSPDAAAGGKSVFDEEEVELEPPSQTASTPDPLRKFNQAMFRLNDKLYFAVFKPVARGYRAVAPEPVRTGVRNFFYNLEAPIRIVASLFQAKGSVFGAEMIRFLMNSTVGVLGFGNPAGKYPELNPPEEDLGQTLASYGIGNGFYIVWPILGPSTLRDSFGTFGDSLLDPVAYVEPWHSAAAISAYERVNHLTFRIGDYEALKEAALDPYEALKDAYLQHRAAKVKE